MRWSGIWRVLMVVTLVAAAACATEAESEADALELGRGSGPSLRDHWHAAFGVYVCDQFLPALPEFDSATGIHTHGDGVIHIHPFSREGEGSRATLGVFLSEAGVDLEDGRLVIDGETYADGDDCDGKAAVLQVAQWDDASPGSLPHVEGDDLTDLRFRHDGEAFTLALVPRGGAIPLPPSAATLDELGAADAGLDPGAAQPIEPSDAPDGFYPVALGPLPADGCLPVNGWITDAEGSCYQLLGLLFTLDAIESATVESESSRQPTVAIALTEAGLVSLNAIASECNARNPVTCPTGQLALVVDGRIVTAPTIEQPSFERDAIVVSGAFTEAEAAELADSLDG